MNEITHDPKEVNKSLQKVLKIFLERNPEKFDKLTKEWMVEWIANIFKYHIRHGTIYQETKKLAFELLQKLVS